MAYAEKYFVTFCKPDNTSCRISILEDSFVGSAVELTAGEFPILISYDNSDDFKFKPIIESKATINLVLNDENVSLNEFWSRDERTFKVEYYEDSILEWTGFIVPKGFDHNFKAGDYNAKIEAIDGLSTLEGILFKTDNNQFYGTQDFGFNNGFSFPFILIATEILKKLDLGLDLWTLVDCYEQFMTDRTTDSRDSDPLAISYIDVKTYINDTDREDIVYWEDINEAWDCKKILENLCHIWGAKIYQEHGVWRLKSVNVDSKLGQNFPILIGSDYWYGATYNTDGSDVFSENKDLYSTDSDLIVNSNVENIIGSGIATDGYYKLKGIDKIVRIASNQVAEVIAYTHPVYYWHQYNNTAGYLGRELIEAVVSIPCANFDKHLLDEATIGTDEVYKQFRVNFDYTFLRVGDSPINLIKNGSFTENYEQYGELEAPPNWERWRHSNKWYPRLRVDALTGNDITNSGGNTHAVRFGQQYNDLNTKSTDPNPAVWASLKQSDIPFTETVKAMQLKIWVKFKYQSTNKEVTYYPIFKSYLINNNSDPRKIYVLKNTISEDYDLDWVEGEYPDSFFDGLIDINDLYISLFTFLEAKNSPEWVDSEYDEYKWYSFDLKIQPPPNTGLLNFDLHGICANKGRISGNFPAFKIKYPVEDELKDKKRPTVRKDWIDDGGDIPRPMFTGIFLGYIPDPAQEVPSSDYIYANGNIDYTLQRDPIRVYNGDTVDPEVVSGITVPLNTSGKKNKWDTASNDFGLTDIGMILCKTIMSQYSSPNRLLEGVVKASNFRHGGVITFESLLYINFVMMRGVYNPIKGYWQDFTLAQISSGALAKGGLINGNSLDPNWVDTGNLRCVKDGNGENTREQEREQQDQNTNSESFGDFRWVSNGTNIDSCPFGEPSDYYWGTDDDVYDINNFTDFTIIDSDDDLNSVTVGYDNEGGKYIYFLHLASLGSVTKISNEYQGQIISSYTYLADITINGYLYRVLRQDFVTSQFDDFVLTYYFN